MAQLHIVGTDVVIPAPQGKSLLSALQNASYPISTSCGGRASCGLCRLMVKKGKELLSSLGENEIVHLGTVAKVIDLRLACQAIVQADGDIVVEIPEVTNVAERKRAQTLASHEQRSRKRKEEQNGSQQNGKRGKKGRRRSEKIEWRPRILAKRENRDKNKKRNDT